MHFGLESVLPQVTNQQDLGCFSSINQENILTQALYAHMNNKTIKKIRKICAYEELAGIIRELKIIN
jgi:hypothetical protein